MPWTKLDDRFWRHRKARKAWRTNPRALGLHLLAMSYCGDEPSDGFVDPEWVDMQFALIKRSERDGAVQTLVDVGLWEPFGDGWQIHDWLDYNPSVEKIEQVREARRLNGALGGKRSGESRRGKPHEGHE